jgi:hypothetical protein
MDLPIREVSNHLKLSLFSYLSSPIKKRQWVSHAGSSMIASNIHEIQLHHIDMLIFLETYTLIYENLDRLTEEMIIPNLPPGLELDPMKRRFEDEKVLEAVYNAWSDHTDCVKKVRHIVQPSVCHSTSALPHTLNVYSS